MNQVEYMDSLKEDFMSQMGLVADVARSLVNIDMTTVPPLVWYQTLPYIPNNGGFTLVEWNGIKYIPVQDE